MGENKINLLGYERDILIYTFRYCLTRKSYAVSTAIELIIKNWSNLSIFDKKLFQKEIKEHFELYDYEKYDMDKNAWECILELPLEEYNNE